MCRECRLDRIAKTGHVDFRMKSLGFTLALVLALTQGTRASSPTHESAPALCVMTYNLRYASPNPPNAWPHRRPLVSEVIQTMAPDVVGTQEGVYSQLKDLAADLPEFEWIGLGREGGSRGEFMAVFYRTARLEPLAYDHFWLSDTPEVMNSATWGNAHRRMVTWVRFRDRATGAELFLFNTHFDHQVQVAREKSADLVRARVAALNTPLPVVLLGDFNAAAGANKAYEILTADHFFTDAWQAAPERKGDGMGTFNDFKAVHPGGPRIDWILVRGDMQVERVEMSTFSRDGQFPSDHFPVAAWLRLAPPK
jgi:endonuclease/exonuclease/phosphatase family metal-dependent hydrolase